MHEPMIIHAHTSEFPMRCPSGGRRSSYPHLADLWPCLECRHIDASSPRGAEQKASCPNTTLLWATARDEVERQLSSRTLCMFKGRDDQMGGWMGVKKALYCDRERAHCPRLPSILPHNRPFGGVVSPLAGAADTWPK